MAMDGKQYDMDLNPIGHSVSFPGLPAHWNCRSTLIPITKTWAQLAKKKLTPKQREALSAVPVGQRASMGGPVQGSVKYEDWLKTQSTDMQQDILGIGKWKLWNEGKISISDLIDNSGRPLTLKELILRFGYEPPSSDR